MNDTEEMIWRKLAECEHVPEAQAERDRLYETLERIKDDTGNAAPAAPARYRVSKFRAA